MTFSYMFHFENLFFNECVQKSPILVCLSSKFSLVSRFMDIIAKIVFLFSHLLIYFCVLGV